jgi:hypothetical protein
MEEYDETGLKNILMRWYNVDFKHKVNFPETFNEMPAHQSANRTWKVPMDYEEVARRLLGETDNDGQNVLPAEIIRFFSEIVESASNRFANLQKQVDDYEHHIRVLERAVEISKAPNLHQDQTGCFGRRTGSFIGPNREEEAATMSSRSKGNRRRSNASVDPGPIKHEVILH